MNRDELEGELASATQQRQEALARLEAAQVRADELAEQQNATRGEIAIAQRAVAEFTERIAQLEQAAAERRTDEARDAVAAAVRARDDTAARAAAAIETSLRLLQELDEQRRLVEQAAETLRSATPTPVPPPPPEPAVLHDPLQRLEAFVRARSDEMPLDEAVTAAATSPCARGILELPAHLQELARHRREHFIRQARAGSRPDAHSDDENRPEGRGEPPETT